MDGSDFKPRTTVIPAGKSFKLTPDVRQEALLLLDCMQEGEAFFGKRSDDGQLVQVMRLPTYPDNDETSVKALELLCNILECNGLAKASELRGIDLILQDDTMITFDHLPDAQRLLQSIREMHGLLHTEIETRNLGGHAVN